MHRSFEIKQYIILLMKTTSQLTDFNECTHLTMYWLKSPEISNCTKRETRDSFRPRESSDGSENDQRKTIYIKEIFAFASAGYE